MLKTFRSSTTLPAKPNYIGAATLTFGNLLIDAADEKAAFIVQAPKTGTISKIGFRTGTVTLGATVDVRLETVDATTGTPSGTLWAANTNALQLILATDDNAWFLPTLIAGASVTKGDVLAVVIANPAVSFGTLNVATIISTAIIAEFPYNALYTGTWAKGVAAPVLALEYSDGSYEEILGAFPWSAISETAYNSGSTPDERGLRFNFPFPVQVAGFWAWLVWAEDCTVKLYDYDDSTVLLSLSVDKDNQSNPATKQRNLFYFSSKVSLLPDKSYILSLLPSTTTNATLNQFSVNTAAIMDGMDGGQNCHLATRTDAGSWTFTTTQRPLMGLIIDAFDNGVMAPRGPRVFQGQNIPLF
jgi:hypothetical protein